VKKIFLAGVALIAVASGTSARAADIAIYKTPPPVAIYSWTGFYVGASAGGMWSHNSTNFSTMDQTIGTFF
jgi:outer membrane immunogenic protein